MRILLATGFSNLERELQGILTSRGDGCWRCYHRQAVVPAVIEYNAETVVLSPALEGDSDLVETVVLSLRQKGIRVVFLPGGVDMPDTKEWLKRLIPYGIYCYVFDPVTPEKVIQRIEKPGSLGDIPAEIRELAREVSENVTAPLDEAFEEAGLMLERTRDASRESRRGWRDVRSVFRLFGKSQTGVEPEEDIAKIPENPAFKKQADGKGLLGKLTGRLKHRRKGDEVELPKRRGTPARQPTEPASMGEKLPEKVSSTSTGRPNIPVLGFPTVLLIGDRAKKLVSGVVARGWKVVDNSSVPPDVAVVDAELLPSVLGNLHCSVIAFSSGRLSEWFSLVDSGVPVASGSDACLALVAGILEDGHNVRLEKRLKKKDGETSEVPEAVPSPSRRRGFVLAFYSGAQGYQGKTVLAVNTAVLLAEKGLSVCLADLDTDKAGLTALCGFSEDNPPPVDLISYVSGAFSVEGPTGVKLIPAPIWNPGWFPDPRQAEMLVARLAAEYDAVVLDFGARIASPAVVAALKSCDRVFLVSTPLRSALTAVARFRGRGLVDVGGEKVAAVINRVGVRGGISPRDAARLLGVDGQFFEVPEDPAVVHAENEALEGGTYHPPVLKKKSLIRPALLVLLDRACRKKKEVELC